MPLIRVVSRMGRPLVAPLQASFGPGGGTLGRSPDCTLTLPDEERHISRRQARVDIEPGGAFISCLSAGNPLIINGEELRHGETRPLVHGDRIHIAEYELCFEETSESHREVGQPEDPFALPHLGPVAASPAAGSAAAEDRRAARLLDDPFAEPPSAGAMIPEGFDPFGEPPPAQALHAAGRSPAFGPASGSATRRQDGGGTDPLGMRLTVDPMAELTASKVDSIDSIFNLKPGMDPLGPDSPLGRPFGEKAPAADTGAADRAGDPIPDDASILSSSFRLPQAIPPTGFGPPDDPVVSWKKPAQGAPAPAPQGWPAPAPVFRGDPGSPQGPPRQPGRPVPRATVAVAAGSDDASELLRALLTGLGLPELPGLSGDGGAAPQPLTADLMLRLGEMLATACDGTVELLQARATLKKELRAEVTMIQAQDNNPLKFAPNGQAALVQLLAPNTVRGFMEPARAFRDAYDDLLAHQIGFVAGMRAAMQGLVGRFDPRVLESRLEGKSVLDALMPPARKARLWELFTSLYGEVAREAEDDFQRLFGQAFVEAYEEQLTRLESSSRPRDGDTPRRRG